MPDDFLPQPSRRVFMKGLATAAAVTSSGMLPSLLWARSAPGKLSGTEFFLDIGEQEVNITGKKAMATLVNGSLPARILHKEHYIYN